MEGGVTVLVLHIRRGALLKQHDHGAHGAAGAVPHEGSLAVRRHARDGRGPGPKHKGQQANGADLTDYVGNAPQIATTHMSSCFTGSAFHSCFTLVMDAVLRQRPAGTPMAKCCYWDPGCLRTLRSLPGRVFLSAGWGFWHICWCNLSICARLFFACFFLHVSAPFY